MRAVIEVEFPRGRLPVEGLRCPSCADELIPGHKISALNAMAEAAGFLGIERASRRKLRRTGTSISVSIDPALLEQIAPGAKPGDEVIVGRQGDRIVIERAEG